MANAGRGKHTFDRTEDDNQPISPRSMALGACPVFVIGGPNALIPPPAVATSAAANDLSRVKYKCATCGLECTDLEAMLGHLTANPTHWGTPGAPTPPMVMVEGMEENRAEQQHTHHHEAVYDNIEEEDNDDLPTDETDADRELREWRIRVGKRRRAFF